MITKKSDLKFQKLLHARLYLIMEDHRILLHFFLLQQREDTT
jgi:hypothetical protein